MTRTATKLALTSAAIALFSAQSALALDADEFANRFSELGRIMGIGIEIGASHTDGDTVTLSDFTLSIPGEAPVEIEGDLVFSGVTETGDGGYFAQTATIEDIDFADDDVAISLQNIMAQGISLPADISPDNAMLLSYTMIERASAGPLVISVLEDDAQDAFVIESIELWTDSAADMSALSSGFVLSGMTANLGLIPDAEAREVFEAFGVETLTSELRILGTWLPSEGVMELTEMSYDIADLGRIDITGVISGYTLELYRDMMKLNMKMAELGEDASMADLDAFDNAMMEIVMNLRLDNAKIRYDDASLFMKVLDFIGKEQGIDGATFASGLKFMVPMVLTEVDNPPLVSMITSALNAFIDNPQSLEIEAAPVEPISFADLDTIEIENDPFILVDMLNIEIRANQ
ncbi:hypothetical protein [Pelagibacterium lentulum]|uniref:DUF2125 domain-containing protein n=1 Tax=Pelagibacterium lentulum TaxID=2029865 RepID=A0A916VVD9_9HYPH|nr:hypothetical protein [Pelagibacterium lentulum]GGA40070.1 hypothetical protein GCM10011499_06940 [Pelagibacterium lentulum]